MCRQRWNHESADLAPPDAQHFTTQNPEEPVSAADFGEPVLVDPLPDL